MKAPAMKPPPLLSLCAACPGGGLRIRLPRLPGGRLPRGIDSQLAGSHGGALTDLNIVRAEIPKVP